MRNLIYFILLFLLSCVDEPKKLKEPLKIRKVDEFCRECFQEDSLLFYDPNNGFGSVYDDFYKIWMRDSKNLSVIHETLKSIGYLKYFKNDFKEYIKYDRHRKSNICDFVSFFVSKDCYELLDSLYLTYNNYEKSSHYFNDFWQRRIREKNDSIVFVIIRDIKQILETGREISFDSNLVNDDLAFQLQGIKNIKEDTLLNKKSVIEYFNFLKEIGWHQSAFHFIAKNPETENLNLNIDSMVKTLSPRKIKIKDFKFAPFIDNDIDGWDECDHSDF